MRPHKHPWLMYGTNDQPWALMIMVPWCHEHYWAALSSHEHSWAWHFGTLSAYKHSWAWYHGALSTYENSWHHFTILMSTSEYFRVLQSTSECSWMLMSAHECSSTWLNNYWKMLISRMNTLQYFRNISVQISPNNKKNWHFLNLHKKGCWKMSKIEFLDP